MKISLFWEVEPGDIIDLVNDIVESKGLIMAILPKVGETMNIARKPKPTEPFNDMWDPMDMDQYVGSQGKVVDVVLDNDPNHPTPQDIALVDIEHPDGNIYTYPYYCLSRASVNTNSTPQQTCSCKTDLLITRGCRCGAFSREQVKKK